MSGQAIMIGAMCLVLGWTAVETGRGVKWVAVKTKHGITKVLCHHPAVPAPLAAPLKATN